VGRSAERKKNNGNAAPLSWKTLAGLILILGAAGALRWARMDLSFYNDEAHAFRRYIAGRFSETKEHKLKWKPVDWEDTLWFNEMGSKPHALFDLWPAVL